MQKVKFKSLERGVTPHLRNEFKKIAEGNRYLGAGFTIVEVLVATLIFSMLITVTTGIFSSVLNTERKVFASQAIQENAVFVLELMAREIRVSTICPSGTTCNTTTLSILHPINGSVVYSLSGGKVTRTVGGVVTEISSPEVNFNRLNFLIRGLTPDCQQPRITVTAQIQNTKGPAVQANIQTTVTARDVREEFENPQSPCP